MDRKKRFGLALLLGIMLVIFPACANAQSSETAAGQAPASIDHDHDHDHDHEQIPEPAPVTISEKDQDQEQVPEPAPVTISEKDHDHKHLPEPVPEQKTDIHPSSGEHEGHDHSAHQDPAWWIPVFGIITITLLFLTTIIGWNIRRKPAFLMPWHRRFAVLTCLSALIHMTLVILYH